MNAPRRRRIPLIGDGNGWWSFLHIDDAAAATALAHLLWSGGWLRIVTLATFLAAAEWLRGHVLSGFPFDLLGYALTANDEMVERAVEALEAVRREF